MQQPDPNKANKTKILYDAVSQNYDIGSFEQFELKLQDPEKRRAFFDGVGSEFDLGTFEQFESKVVKKKDTTSATAVGTLDTSLPQPSDASVSTDDPNDISSPNFRGQLVRDLDAGLLDDRLEELKQENLAFQEERDAQVDNLLQQYKSSTALTDEDLDDIDQTIEDEKNMDFGFLGNIKNAIVSTPLIGTFQNPLFNPMKAGNIEEKVSVQKRMAEEQGVDVNDIDGAEVDKEYEKQKRQQLAQGKKDAKTEEFIETLSEEDQRLLNNHFTIKGGVLSSESYTQLMTVENLADEINTIADQLKEADDAHDPNAEYPQEYYENNRQLQRRGRELITQYNDSLLKLNKTEDDLLEVNNEIDLFKRNYNKWDNFTGKFFNATEDLVLNIGYLINKGNMANPTFIASSIELEYMIVERKRFLAREKEKLRRGKTVDDINSIEDGVEWALDLVAEQAPNTILMASTGGSGLAIVGVSSAGGKLFDLEEEERMGIADYSEGEKYLTALMTGGFEALSERISLGQINKAKRVFTSIGRQELKETVTDQLRRNLDSKNVLQFLKDGFEEGGSEALSQLGENIMDKYYLGKTDVNLTDGLKESFVSGAFMSSVVYKAPAIGNELVKPFVPKDFNQKIGENAKAIIDLNEQLKLDINDVTKARITEKRDDLVRENNRLMSKAINDIDNLSASEKTNLLDIENSIHSLRIEAKNIRQDNNVNEKTKKALVEDLNKRANELQEQKENILNKPESTVSAEARSFADQLSGNTEDVSQFVNGAIKTTIGDSDVIIRSEGDNIKIESISTPTDKRGQGSAREAVQKVVDVADEQGKTLELNVVPLDDTTTADGLVNFYESLGFVKDENFDQQEDGGRMVREPEVDESFSGIDSILNEESSVEIPNSEVNTTENQETNETESSENIPNSTQISTDLNNYTVQVVDGNLDIQPEFGQRKPSASEIRKVTEQYINETNFDAGQRADFSDKGNLDANQISEVIANESQNAVEVANEIKAVKERNQDAVQNNEASKNGAIAQALQSTQVNRESFSQVDDPNNVGDVNPFYFSSARKTITGQEGNIDRIRERAQQFTDEEVSLEDVTDFIKNNRTPNQFLEQENTTSTADLELKFEQLTGLKATDTNVEKVSGTQQQTQEGQVEEDTENDGVPFQRESNQTRIVGSALSGLVNRLKKTGLAKDVRILSDTQISNVLNEINDKENVYSQIDYNNQELLDIRDKAIEEGNFLLAPNGNKTNLTRTQWLQVRTDSFKEWFGDWQNDPENSSKALDENGEPRVFYHGTNAVFNIFNTGASFNEASGGLEGSYFTPFKEEVPANGVVMPVFLNIRNPETVDFDNNQQDKEFFLDFRKKSDLRNPDSDSLISVSENDKSFNEYIVFEPNQIKSATSNSGSFDTNNPDIRFQQSNEATPNGFVYNDEVYLNRDKVKTDTPIHEFGHLWNAYAKENYNAVFKRGLELIENSEYHLQVKNNPAYNNLNNEQQLEEALAQAIGEKGVKILNESKKKKFNAWFKRLFTRIAKGLGITSLNADQLADLSLDKFTDLVGAELLAGQEIQSTSTPQRSRSNVTEQADVSNIDVVVAEQKAIKETTDKLREQFRDRNVFIDDIKKALVDYIKSNIDSQRMGELQKSELTKLLSSVRKAKTKKNLQKSFDQVNDIVTGLDNKILKRKIDKILGSRLSKKESGRRKANITTEEAETVLNTIKNNIATPKTKDGDRTVKERRNDRLVELFDRRDTLQSKADLSEAESLELEATNVSIDLLGALLSDNVNTANELYNTSFDYIEAVFQEGRSELKELREQRKREDQELLDSIEEDINPEGLTSLKTVEELNQDNKQLKNILKRSVFNLLDGSLIGSLDSIASLLSRKGGQNRDSSPLVQFVNKLKSRETLKKTRIGRFSKQVNDLQKDIFGSTLKANKALNKKVTLTLERHPDLNQSEPKEPIDVPFTYSQLLNVWMNSKNPDLLAGLETNGFDSDVIDQIDSMLPDTVKEYGEALFNVYEDMYNDSNEVYKRMNFHSLGKQENYAGKVYRSNTSLKEDTDALLGGVASINTTGYGSQKERVKNDKPIEAVDVNYLVQKAIQESSHYVAYAEAHREYNKILKDNKIQKAIQLTNKGNGDQIMRMLNYYKVRDLEQGGDRGIGIIDFFGRNIAKSTLALKAKIGLTQTISVLNGSFDMPTGLSPVKFLSYYNPKKMVETATFLMRNSDYLKNRYDVGGIDEAMLGLSSLAQQSEFAFTSSDLEAKRKAVARFYKNMLDKAMLNVKLGDRVGVMGAVPAYNAWYDKFRKEGDSEAVAREKAMKKFESAVDRSQQTTSAFGKSQFQKHPVARYFAMFATAPIQNQQNAMFHFRELRRGLLKGQDKAKGNNIRNAMAFLNYQFAQPILYTYIAQLMAGSLSRALGFGDEEPDDADKDLLRSAIMGNSNSIPVFGGLAQLILETAILDKDFSFGSLVSSALLDNTTKLQDQWLKAFTAKTEKSRQTNLEKAMRNTAGLFLAFPNILSDTAIDMDEIYFNDEIDNEVKFLKLFGYSNFVIEQSRKQRESRAKSEAERQRIRQKYENSIKKYEREKTKTNPLFKPLEEEDQRK